MRNFDIHQTIKSYFPDSLMAFARKTDPETSKEAAGTVDVSKLEQVVLDAIKAFPEGCISQDIENALPHIRVSSITPRFNTLLRKNLIVDTGEKRRGFSGRNQRVVRAV